MYQPSALRHYGRQLEHRCRTVRHEVLRQVVGRFNPPAFSLYDALMTQGFGAKRVLHIAAPLNIVYAMVPKSGCTRIRATLNAHLYKLRGVESHAPRPSLLRGPRDIGISTLHRLVSDPAALRFAFVRNPYDRLVSCWANKFEERPLVRSSPEIARYLDLRVDIDPSLPAGLDRTLSFGDFITFVTAAATLGPRGDWHWQPQSDLLAVPGVQLNFIGRFERFNEDFCRVLDFLNADDIRRRQAAAPMNASQRAATSSYYTSDLAAAVYRAYEHDFDRFGYQRALPS